VNDPGEKDDIEESPFTVSYNPTGDGSCQFAAISHQLVITLL
jgi:hypothetical protein